MAHIGEPGQTLVMPLMLVFKMDCSTEEFPRWLHKLSNENGDVVTWWGGHELRYADTPSSTGEVVKLRDVIVASFKVKTHSAYYDVKETIVTHLRQDQTAEQIKQMRLVHKRRREDLIERGICLKCEGTQIRHGKPCRHCCGGW